MFVFRCGIRLLLLVVAATRRLGAARIVERRLVIVSGSDCGDCEGSCAFPGGALKGNSSGLLVSLSYLSCG